MRTVGFAAILALGSIVGTSGQIWREPYVATRHVEALNRADAPVQLAAAAANSGIRRPRLVVWLRRHESAPRNLPLRGLMLRLAAGPLQHGMITFLLRAVPEPNRSSILDPIFPDGWDVREFVPLPDEDAPGLATLKRDTKILITVEKVTNSAGRVVYNAPDSRERLWERLAPPLPLLR